MAEEVRRGGIWMLELRPPDKRRPVLVLSRQSLIRVLHTVTTRYPPNTWGYLTEISQVQSLDPTGRYALVQGLQFGWLDLDLGRFTPLPPYSSQDGVYAIW